jgi:hypothetical protein
MNIPSGKQIISKLETKDLNSKNMIRDLMNKKFSGYITVTINQQFGFEDGLLIFSNGIIKGAHYVLLKENNEIFGEDAIKLILNALGAKYGTLDVYQLTKEQVELMLTFNEKTKVTDIADISKIEQFFVNDYNTNITAKYSSQKQEDSKYDIFKKIGLGNIRI